MPTVQHPPDAEEAEAGFSVPADRSAWGREGARRRWGTHVPRTVRLDGFTAEERRAILALIGMARASKAAEPTDQAA